MQSPSTYSPRVFLKEGSIKRINDLLSTVVSNDFVFLREEVNKSDDDAQEGHAVDFRVIRELSMALKEIPNGPHLCELLQGSEIELPAPTRVPRNPELELRLDKLRNQSKNKEYVTMTKNVDLTYQASHMTEFRTDIQELRSQLVAVINFVITVFACFLFGYKAVEYSLPTPNLAGQVIAGIVIASFGALADLYFLAKQIENTS